MFVFRKIKMKLLVLILEIFLGNNVFRSSYKLFVVAMFCAVCGWCVLVILDYFFLGVTLFSFEELNASRQFENKFFFFFFSLNSHWKS